MTSCHCILGPTVVKRRGISTFLTITWSDSFGKRDALFFRSEQGKITDSEEVQWACTREQIQSKHLHRFQGEEEIAQNLSSVRRHFKPLNYKAKPSKKPYKEQNRVEFILKLFYFSCLTHIILNYSFRTGNIWCCLHAHKKKGHGRRSWKVEEVTSY